MHRAPAAAGPRLRQNRQTYEQILDVVRRRAAAADVEGVLRSATVAAAFAWSAPTGLLNDPDLERLVVSTVQGDGGGPTLDATRRGGRILHVLSEGYLMGGHTRLAWRWIRRDSRRSDVAVTNQRGPLPEPLQEAATASGGRVHDLRAAAPTLSARAAALRALMDEADTVVYHVHPYDAVALAAAALPGPRPPVILENHADHTFWLGLGCADLVSDYRRESQRLSREVRGVRAERLGLLPLPIDDAPAPAGADQARRQLGVGRDDVLAISVASDFKMSPVWGRGFDPILTKALTAFPRLKIALVGVRPVGPWAALAQRFRGRLLPVGPLPDVAPVYAAADLYLNSYPIPAGTSVLEAAVAGLPVVTLRDLVDRQGYTELFQADSPGLDNVPHAVADDDRYLAMLRKLVRDPALRAARGAAARDNVLAVHAGAGWTGALEDLYRQAREVPAADLGEYPEAPEDAGLGAMVLSFASSLHATPDPAATGSVLGAQLDVQLTSDLFAATRRELRTPVVARAAEGWEDHPAWTKRLLTLASEHDRLTASVPFLREDDAEGTRSVARLTALLAEIGLTTDNCGDVRLEGDHAQSGMTIDGETPFSDDALDRLERLVSSPCWEPVENQPTSRTAIPALAG